jgi:flagellar protein FliS
MNPNSAASAYKRASIEHAPPLKIVHMMYEGALRFLAQAGSIDPKTSYPAFQEKVHRTDAIVCELRASLQPTESGDVSHRLASLYVFVEDKLREALSEKSVEPLAAAREVLETLLDGWKQIDVESERRPA